ncbi:MAG TPA: enoyl-CoA hydratase-related protein, partial [Ktedonobacterales bacterium]|nr:enoyl-CoA hydratase-related protein [Ktedonobacterales bacterium]
MTYDSILVGRDAPVATITMNRPEKRNALSSEMMRELNDALRTLSAEPEVRAIVLAANGPAFSAGHDLRELVDGDINRYRAVFDLCTELMETIQAIPQPVIARVHRIATAAGCQLVATCDLAVAAEEATFGTPGVKIGLFCTTPMVALSRAIGRKRALQMLMTG